MAKFLEYPESVFRGERAWKALVKRYADGRPICNCGEAYYTPCGEGSVQVNGIWEDRTDLPACEGGCSTNKIRAKEEIALRIIEELGLNKDNAE